MARYEIVIKKVEPMKVVSVRGVIPKPQDQNLLWHELGEYLSQRRVRPQGACMVLYHDAEPRQRDWDIEVCEPVEADLAPINRIKAYHLPGVETMACVIHAGPLAKIGEAYEALLQWLNENQYQIAGPYREIYLREAYPDGNPNDPNAMTEIQYPVEGKSKK